MVQSARTIDDFIATIAEKKVQFALITPTSSFIGTHLAEALLAQNIAVLCEVTNNEQVAAYTKHLQNNPLFFITDHTHQHAIPLNLPPPKYIIYDVDESFRHFSATDNISFTISLETKRLLEYATSHKARFVLLSQIEDASFDPFAPPKPFDPSPSTNTKVHQEQLKRFVETLVVESMEKSPLDGKIIHYAQVFGPRMVLDQGSFVSASIRHVIANEPIVIAGDGLISLYPLYISDFIYGVIKTLFATDQSSKTYTLSQPQGATELSFAHTLQQQAGKIGKAITIEFEKQDHDRSLLLQHGHQAATEALNWQPKVDLAEGLARTLGFFAGSVLPTPPSLAIPTSVAPISRLGGPSPDPRAAAPQPVTIVSFLKQEPKAGRTAKPSLALFIGLVASVCILATIGVLAPAIIFDYFTQRVRVASAKTDPSRQALARLQSTIQATQTVGRYTTLANKLLHRESEYERTRTNLRIIDYRLTALIAADQASLGLGQVFSPTSRPFDQLLEEANLTIAKALTSLQIAEALAKTQSPLGKFVAPDLDQAQTAHVIDQAAATGKLFGLLYQGPLLSTTGQKERTLVLLLVDNTILRPGGGVVVGSISVTTKPQIQPVHSPFDPATIVAVPPPPPPLTKTSLETFRLTEALATPVFSTNINSFLQPLQTAIKKPIDGVLTIDIPALQALVAITGPIAVTNQTVDDKNVTSFISSHQTSQINELLDKVVDKALATPLAIASLQNWLGQALNTQDVQISLTDPNLASLLKGHQMTPLAGATNYLGIFDTSLNPPAGANQAKTIHHDIVIDKKLQVSERVVLTYAPSNQARAKGAYQVISQIYLPKDRTVTRVTVNKKPVTITEATVDAGKIITTTITPGAVATEVSIEYKRVLPIGLVNNQAVFETTLINQAGAPSLAYELAISSPILQLSAPGFDLLSDGILVKGNVDTAKTFTISLTK